MSATAPDFSLNPHRSATVIHVGIDREPVLIVDDLLLDPQVLLRCALDGQAFGQEAKDFYPGVRKTLDLAYGRAVCLGLREQLLATFGADANALTGPSIAPLSCLLSLTTTPEAVLRPIQSVPHFDGFERSQIAGVHYLCTEEFGGTAFYRHRSTGFENLDAERIATYAPRLKGEVMALGARSWHYIRGDTALFERIGGVAARFNRAIYYRSNVLHSGDIPAVALPADPRCGRLTANTLFRIG